MLVDPPHFQTLVLGMGENIEGQEASLFLQTGVRLSPNFPVLVLFLKDESKSLCQLEHHTGYIT